MTRYKSFQKTWKKYMKKMVVSKIKGKKANYLSTEKKNWPEFVRHKAELTC